MPTVGPLVLSNSRTCPGQDLLLKSENDIFRSKYEHVDSETSGRRLSSRCCGTAPERRRKVLQASSQNASYQSPYCHIQFPKNWLKLDFSKPPPPTFPPAEHQSLLKWLRQINCPERQEEVATGCITEYLLRFRDDTRFIAIDEIRDYSCGCGLKERPKLWVGKEFTFRRLRKA